MAGGAGKHRPGAARARCEPPRCGSRRGTSLPLAQRRHQCREASAYACATARAAQGEREALPALGVSLPGQSWPQDPHPAVRWLTSKVLPVPTWLWQEAPAAGRARPLPARPQQGFCSPGEQPPSAHRSSSPGSLRASQMAAGPCPSSGRRQVALRQRAALRLDRTRRQRPRRPPPASRPGPGGEAGPQIAAAAAGSPPPALGTARHGSLRVPAGRLRTGRLLRWRENGEGQPKGLGGPRWWPGSGLEELWGWRRSLNPPASDLLFSEGSPQPPDLTPAQP